MRDTSEPIARSGADVRSGQATAPLPSFEDIYKQYFDFVWSSARHLGAERDAVDDVVQDAFIVIHSRLVTLQRPEALRSWIYGVVRRTASDHRRSRRTRDAARARLGTELKWRQPPRPSPLEMAERNDHLVLLESVLAEIDEPKREIFVMVEILEMTVPEVAQALAMPLNTAYSRLRRARQSFEEALAEHGAIDQARRRLFRTLVPAASGGRA
jgi:RNA polymerase sigma-70 factor (ECF subfamily)